MAVDGLGNVYIANTYNSQILEWSPSNNVVSTLVNLGSYNYVYGVAMDAAGDVDFTDTTLNQWSAAGSNVTSLVTSGLFWPRGVAVDAAGNIYFLDSYYDTLREWSPSNNTASTLASTGLSYPYGAAVDGGGNVLHF